MDKKKLIRILGFVAFIAAGCFSLFPVFYGLDFTDTFYLSCQHLYSGKTSPFLPLTQGLYLLTNKIFGDHVIAYRFVNWAIYLLAYVMGFYLLCKGNTKERPEMLFLLAFSLVTLPLTNSNVFAGNSLTTLFIVLSFVSIQRAAIGKRKWMIGTCIFLALAMLSRLPNIVLLFVILFVGLMTLPRKDYTRLFLSLVGAVLIYSITSVAIHGGLHEYISALSSSLNTMNASEGSNHSTSTLLDGYFHSLKDMMGNIKYLAIISAIPVFANCFKNRAWKYFGILAFLICHLAFVLTQVKLIEDIHYFLLIYLYANISILIFAICIKALIQHDFKGFGLAIGILLFSVCGAAGSDMSLYLMGGPLLALVPWLLTLTTRSNEKTSNDENLKLVISLLLLAICAFLYVRKGLMPVSLILILASLASAWIFARKSITPSFLKETDTNANTSFIGAIALYFFCAILSIHAICNVTFGDLSPKELKSSYQEPKLKWIKTNTLSHNLLESVMSDYRVDSQQNKVLFFGANSAVFSYLTEKGMISGVDFTQDPSPRNLASVEKAIESHPTLYLCPENPARPVWYSLEDYHTLDSIMLVHGYSCKEKGHYKIFYPNTLEVTINEDSIQ